MQARRMMFAAIALSMCAGAAAFFGGPAPGLLPSAASRSNTHGSLSLRTAPIPLMTTARRRGEARGAGVVMMAKKKLTDAQIKALEALEQFETMETAGAPAPVVEEPKKEKKIKKKKKGPWVPGQVPLLFIKTPAKNSHHQPIASTMGRIIPGERRPKRAPPHADTPPRSEEGAPRLRPGQR